MLYTVKDVIIANGQSLSGEIDLNNIQTMAFIMPDTWTAANLTLQAARKPSALGGVYRDVYDDVGVEVNIVAAANRIIAIDINALKIAGLRYIKLRSGTTAAPVNQTADRTLYLIGK